MKRLLFILKVDLEIKKKSEELCHEYLYLNKIIKQNKNLLHTLESRGEMVFGKIN